MRNNERLLKISFAIDTKIVLACHSDLGIVTAKNLDLARLKCLHWPQRYCHRQLSVLILILLTTILRCLNPFNVTMPPTSTRLFTSIFPSTLRACPKSKRPSWGTCQRAYSIQAEAASARKLLELDPSKLSVTKTTTPKELTPQEDLVFGRYFTGN